MDVVSDYVVHHDHDEASPHISEFEKDGALGDYVAHREAEPEVEAKPETQEQKPQNVVNNFVIKYRDSEERSRLSEYALRLIHEFNLRGFQVEEKYYLLRNSISYNGEVLDAGNNIQFERIHDNFAELMRQQENY